jgi:hypothetical protein
MHCDGTIRSHASGCCNRSGGRADHTPGHTWGSEVPGPEPGVTGSRPRHRWCSQDPIGPRPRGVTGVTAVGLVATVQPRRAGSAGPHTPGRWDRADAFMYQARAGKNAPLEVRDRLGWVAVSDRDRDGAGACSRTASPKRGCDHRLSDTVGHPVRPKPEHGRPPWYVISLLLPQAEER